MKTIKKAIFLMLFIALNPFILNAQSETNFTDAKLIHLDVGYGSYNLSLGAGYKHTFGNIPFSIGGAISIAGFTTDIPNYITNTYQVNIYSMPESKFTTFIVTGDVNAYYEWKELSFFGSLGFYSQSDTVLAIEEKPTYKNYYYKKTASESGLTFGAGIQYYFKEDMIFGIGYQTKKGIYLQIGYSWF
jgi:opacity protein-like surface antigen